jgi:hypothetical protein
MNLQNLLKEYKQLEVKDFENPEKMEIEFYKLCSEFDNLVYTHDIINNTLKIKNFDTSVLDFVENIGAKAIFGEDEFKKVYYFIQTQNNLDSEEYKIIYNGFFEKGLEAIKKAIYFLLDVIKKILGFILSALAIYPAMLYFLLVGTKDKFKKAIVKNEKAKKEYVKKQQVKENISDYQQEEKIKDDFFSFLQDKISNKKLNFLVLEVNDLGEKNLSDIIYNHLTPMKQILSSQKNMLEEFINYPEKHDYQKIFKEINERFYSEFSPEYYKALCIEFEEGTFNAIGNTEKLRDKYYKQKSCSMLEFFNYDSDVTGVLKTITKEIFITPNKLEEKIIELDRRYYENLGITRMRGILEKDSKEIKRLYDELEKLAKNKNVLENLDAGNFLINILENKKQFDRLIFTITTQLKAFDEFSKRYLEVFIENIIFVLDELSDYYMKKAS